LDPKAHTERRNLLKKENWRGVFPHLKREFMNEDQKAVIETRGKEGEPIQTFYPAIPASDVNSSFTDKMTAKDGSEALKIEIFLKIAKRVQELANGNTWSVQDFIRESRFYEQISTSQVIDLFDKYTHFLESKNKITRIDGAYNYEVFLLNGPV
jgi:hypothetical protein